MAGSGADRRRYPRSRSSVPLVREEVDAGLLNHVDNISANGVLCHTQSPVPLMTRLRIVIDLPQPGGKRVEADGVVVRCDPHEMGDDQFKVAILFTKIEDEDQRAIRHFVEHDLAESAEHGAEA